MKTHGLIPVLSVLCLLFMACNQSPESHSSDPLTNETKEGLRLNNGKKWEANHATVQGISEMQQAVDGFSHADDREGCTALKRQLEDSYYNIFEHCNMTGEAHLQLHHVLVPMQEMIAAIDTTDPVLRKRALTELKTQLELFDQYFSE